MDSGGDELIYHERNIAFDPGRVAEVIGTFESPDNVTALSNFGPVELSWRDLTFDVPAASEPAPNRNGARSVSQTLKLRRSKSKTSAGDDSRNGDAGEHDVLPPSESIRMKLHPDFIAKEVAGASSSRRLARILHGLHGSARPGQMLAILGSSGSGKSTLLNLLAGRIKSAKGCISGGTVLVNGTKRNFASFKKVACYVEQDEAMFAELTVEEQLRYSALLRLPSSLSRQDKMRRVQDVIQELGLSGCKDTKIGSQTIKGISGGERKRLSIGTELVTNPSLLLLDEPTTGLDAFNALNVVTNLRHLASKGRTVVTTMHQPRSSIYALFDLLCILSEGRLMYFGPAKDARTYFAGLSFQAPLHFNFADYVIDAVSIDYRSRGLETKTKKRVLYFAKEQINQRCVDIESATSGCSGSYNSEPIPRKGEHVRLNMANYPNSVLVEFVILLDRAFKRGRRERLTNLTRIIRSLVFGVLLGLIWLNKGRQSDLQSQLTMLGVVFFLGINQGFDGSFSVIFDFQTEKTVLNRERSSGSYRTLSYFAASSLVNLLKSVVLNLVFVSIVYWMVGLRSNVARFLFTVMTTTILTQTGEAISQCISVFTGSIQVTAAVVPLVVVLKFLFAGFFITRDALPVFLRWVQKISFLYWGFQALVKNQFGNQPFPSTFRLANEFNDYSRWENVFILLAFTLVGKALFFATLLMRRPKFDTSL